MIIFYYNDNKQNDKEHVEKIFKEIKSQDENNFELDKSEKPSNKSLHKDIKSECVKHSFNVNLKRLRKSLKLTQEQLAETLNIPYRTLLNWELGKREPSARNLCMLSQYFNVHPIDLMGASLESPSIINEESIKKTNKFSDNLKIIRNNMNLTQKDFAEYVGLTLKTLINYENDCRLPDFTCLKTLSEKLNVDPFELVGTGKE